MILLSLNVAHLAGLPIAVLEKAKSKSEEMEAGQLRRTIHRQQHSVSRLFQCIIKEDVDGFKKTLSDGNWLY
ncbi:hypothetical protein [Absidia glauca]|uniref:Uncharacterized protein n=1 Tax=Absidia glauca TaxID=4829 RepID=A0A163J7N6_ABSGL|nr:hypothetical protein [Absidia glauca]